MVNGRRQAAGGFTLIEVLVALAVTGIGLAGITAMASINAHGSSYARHASEATILAEDKLEMLRVSPVARLTAGTDVVDAQGRPGSADDFTRTWTLTADGALVRIGVTVTWPDIDGARTLSLAAVRAQ